MVCAISIATLLFHQMQAETIGDHNLPLLDIFLRFSISGSLISFRSVFSFPGAFEENRPKQKAALFHFLHKIADNGDYNITTNVVS